MPAPTDPAARVDDPSRAAEPRRPRVTEAGASGDSAKELREKKRVLAALVVHDLRSPLSAVQGSLELLRDEIGPDASPQIKQYLDDATVLIHKALGLVATILDVEELEDGILHAYLQP